MKNLAERLIIVTAFSTFAVTGLAHCTVQVTDTADGAADATSDATTDTEVTDALDLDATPPSTCVDAANRCQCAITSAALGRECSPTKACPAELDCIYKPGCDDPKGSCLAWARCSDSGLRQAPMCSCDGILRGSRTQPWAFADDAGRFGKEGNSCGADAGGD